MPDRVLRLGERIDDADSERDGRNRGIERPIGAGYPAKLAAYPARSHLIPSVRFWSQTGSTREVSGAFWTSVMKFIEP